MLNKAIQRTILMTVRQCVGTNATWGERKPLNKAEAQTHTSVVNMKGNCWLTMSFWKLVPGKTAK
jgi:hypothetical protein